MQDSLVPLRAQVELGYDPAMSDEAANTDSGITRMINWSKHLLPSGFAKRSGLISPLCLALLLLVIDDGGVGIAQTAEMAREAPRPEEGPVADVSFGLKGGLSFSQHYGTEERHPEYHVSSQWRESFALGAFLYFPVTCRFGLQQEVLYVRKGSHQDISLAILEVPTTLDVTYDADYLEIPVLLRFAWLRSEHLTVGSFSGFAMSLMVHDSYRLRGEVDDGNQVIPLRADADMREVDMFDYAFTYGTLLEFVLWGRQVGLEHRFTIGWNTLSMPTYAYVPFEDDQILIENEPVPLKNQNHLLLLSLRF